MQILEMLKQIHYSAPPKIQLITYKTLCRPWMEFVVEVWNSVTNDENGTEQCHLFHSKLKGRNRGAREKERLGLERRRM